MHTSTVHTVGALQEVLDQSKLGFEVARVPAAAADQWSVVDGALQHRSRGFFSVVGVRFDNGGDLVFLYQPQGAVTGLLTARVDGERCFLLQARAEPGCLREAQFGPTVQSTPANFMRFHGGASTPYIDAFIAHAPHLRIIDDTTQLDLGERYLCKSKRSILIETAAPEQPAPGFVWVTCDAIRQGALKSAFFNIDLRSILSIAAWDEDSGLLPRSELVRRSAAAPLRPDVVGAVLLALSDAPRNVARFIPLADAAGWRMDEWGWRERLPRQGFAIEFFAVEAALRERASWIQPLANSSGDGRVSLACRIRGDTLEVFVNAAREAGLSTSAALAPSHVQYPGVETPAPAWLSNAVAWSGTTESDEGGRFFRDASRYEIVRTDDWPGDENGFWLTLAELKLMLRTSNLCTIQLRGVVSQLLGVV